MRSALEDFAVSLVLLSPALASSLLIASPALAKGHRAAAAYSGGGGGGFDVMALVHKIPQDWLIVLAVAGGAAILYFLHNRMPDCTCNCGIACKCKCKCSAACPCQTQPKRLLR